MARTSLDFVYLIQPSPTLKTTYWTDGFYDSESNILVLNAQNKGLIRVPLSAVREYKLSSRAVPPDAPAAPPQPASPTPVVEAPPKPNAAQKKR